MSADSGSPSAADKEDRPSVRAILPVVLSALVLYGVVHLLTGWLAVQIAWSASDSKSADTSERSRRGP